MYMNTLKRLTLAICIILLMNACAPLRAPVVVKNSPIEKFKYAYISPTKELTSSTGSTYGGQYGIYGSSTTKSVNPSDVIAGILIQKGYVILPELNPELAKETLIVNYGESGRGKPWIRLHNRGNDPIHIGVYARNVLLLHRRGAGFDRSGRYSSSDKARLGWFIRKIKTTQTILL